MHWRKILLISTYLLTIIWVGCKRNNQAENIVNPNNGDFDSSSVIGNKSTHDVYFHESREATEQYLEDMIGDASNYDISAQEPIRIPVTLHAAVGLVFDNARVNGAIERLNLAFRSAKVEFYQCSPVDYSLPSTIIKDEHSELLKNEKVGSLNIYIVKKIQNSSEGITAGYATLPYKNGERFVIIDNDYFDSSILIHEVGHFFGLRHTFAILKFHWLLFEKYWDGIKDTPFDPGIGPEDIDDNCNYTGELSEPPLTNNFMSYLPAKCLTSFTNDQSKYVAKVARTLRNNLSCSCMDLLSDSIIDRDGNYYKVVKVGNQTWMAENLRVTTDFGGRKLVSYDDQPENYDWNRQCFNGGVTGSGYYGCLPGYKSYKNSEHDRIFGKLYTHHAITTGLCPEGFRTARVSDWQELFSYIGGIEKAGKLKVAPYWPRINFDTNLPTMNEYCFDVHPLSPVKNSWGNSHGGFWCIESNKFDIDLTKENSVASVISFSSEDKGARISTRANASLTFPCRCIKKK